MEPPGRRDSRIGEDGELRPPGSTKPALQVLRGTYRGIDADEVHDGIARDNDGRGPRASAPAGWSQHACGAQRLVHRAPQEIRRSVAQTFYAEPSRQTDMTDRRHEKVGD